MTMSEKILARAAGKKGVKAGEIVEAEIDQGMTHCGGGPLFFRALSELNPKKMKAIDRLIVMIGHTMPPIAGRANNQDIVRKNVKKYHLEHNFYDSKYGVMHNVMMWKGHVRPGELVVATDSHTTTMGVLGAFATGIGPTELAYAVTFGKIWLRVPETIKIVLKGKLQKHVFSKDIGLYLAGKYGTDIAQYKAIEFTGPAVEALSIDARTTLCVMGVELGAKAAMFPADAKTVAFVKERTDRPFTPALPDQDGTYLQEIEVDIGSLEPQIACPHDVGNVKPLSEVEGKAIHQATIGTCTNGSYEDLEIAAKILAGRKVNPEVRFYVTPNTAEAYTKAVKSGVAETLMKAEAVLVNAQCGSCSGHIAVLSRGEVCLAAQNRNFKGRMGNPDSEIFLASPATVAASAIEGRITNPNKYLS
jgi:3-isopropylmalate/(R)-2-methylmalate dehydratase large subunit